MTDFFTDYQQNILPTYAPPPILFVRGEGSYLYDNHGKQYIDFGGGIAVLSLGHCAPSVTATIAEQSPTLMYLSNLHLNQPAIKLAKQLCQNTFAQSVFFCNSGAEANEAAIKLARQRGVKINPEKYQVISFTNSFHGRLGLSMAATGQGKVKDGFGPLAPGFITLPFNDVDQLNAHFGKKICAVILEPVQGEGGVNIAQPAFLQAIKSMAQAHDALVIFDEIQTGAGRTGALYNYMKTAIVPDLLTTAKGLGNGFPIGALLVGEAGQGVLQVGSHGTTFGGNALATAVGNTVLEQILQEGFLPAVLQKGEKLAASLQAINDKLNPKPITAIRQAGLLIGCDIAPAINIKDLIRAAQEEGLIILSCGTNAMRLAPALNIPDTTIDEGLTRLEKAFRQF